MLIHNIKNIKINIFEYFYTYSQPHILEYFIISKTNRIFIIYSIHSKL